jgi:hypothetical protein
MLMLLPDHTGQVIISPYVIHVLKSSDYCTTCKERFAQGWTSNAAKWTYVGHSIGSTELNEYSAYLSEAISLTDPVCTGQAEVITCDYSDGISGDFIWATAVKTPADNTMTLSVD